MAEFVPGFNQLSFDPNSFAGSSQIGGEMKSFNRLNFNILYGGETKALIMKNYYDIGTRLSYVVLSTDDSLDPDQATELTTILEYELQENEFLVSVELHGRNPTSQVGNMHQIFTKNLRTWDFYSSKEGDNDPREVRVCFNAAKEPAVQSFTFNTYGASVGLSSFVWNGTEYPCNHTELATTPFVLYKPSLALKYKHDNVAYTMDDAVNVKTTGKQKISGLKIFAQQPEVTAEPSKDTHLVTKGYFDKFLDSYMGTAKKRDLSLSIISQADASNLEFYYNIYTISFSKFKVLLSDGRRLDPLYIEKMSDSLDKNLTRKRVVLTVNLQDQEDPQPTSKTKEEMDAYQLQDGEFFATFISGYELKNIDNYFFKPRWDDIHPWDDYYEPASHSYWTDTPLVAFKLIVHDIDLNIAKCSFETGSGTKLSKYYAAELSDGVAQSVLKEYKTPQAGTLVFDFGGLSKFVNVDSDQVINGVKTFAAVPKITAEPTEDTDAVNKKYIEEHFVSRPPKYDFKIEITCEGNSSYVAYSELKINLTGGKVIEPLYLEKREAKPDNNIYRFVYKISDASAVTVKQTPRKSSSEMDTYQLQDGEYIGNLYYAGHFSSATVMNAYDNQTDPWFGYLFNGGSGKLTMCQIILSGLPTDVTGIAFKSGDKHNSFGYKSAKYGAKFTYGKKSQEHELTNAQATHEFLVDSNALAPEAGNSGFVELAGDQSINGVKTFLTPPKSMKAPTDAKDIANKAYVDNRLGAGFDVTFTIKQSFSATWGGLSKLHVELAKGVLEAKYVEDVMPANAKEPALVVWTTKSTATKDPQVTYKSKEDIKGYELQDGEYLGDITYAELLGPYKSHTSADYRCPFDTYLYNGGMLGQKPLIKVNIYSLKQAVKSVRYLNGYDGSSYVGADHAVDFVVNNVESTSTLTGAGTSDDAPFVFTPTVKTLFDNEKSNYVPIKGDAIIFDKKTFKKKVFITDPYLSSEMVHGQVATMESLKAVGLIGKALPDTQYICLWGDLREAKKRSAKDNKNATYEMSELELHTATGQLYLKYMEEISAAVPNASKPQPSEVGLCVLSRKKEWDNTTDLPVKTNAFLKSYTLQPGEFLAKVRVINGAWRSGLSSGAQTGVAPYGSNGNFAGLFATRAKNNDYAKFSCYMQGVINAETVVNQTFRYAEIIIYNAPAIEKIKLTSARDSYYSINAADGGINTINAFISTDEKFNSFDKITSYIGGVVTEAADNSTKMYFDEGSKTAGYTTSPKSVEVPLTNYEEGTSQTESADAAYGYLQAVTISNDQDIAGNKTFIKPITCTEPPVENGHLVNKKYVDDELAKLVTRIAALEAAKP